jgi:CheY-like chemotaxis protein
MGKKKVLVVDDSRTALLMETTILPKAEFEIVTANDGVEAIQKATTHSPDVILMDVNMPRLDGLSACRELKRNPSTREIPIILVTTRGEEEHLTNGYLAGCSDYITKPVDATELVAKVRNVVGGSAC